MLGAAELPSDILRDLLSTSLDCDDDYHDDDDDSDAEASRSASRSRRFRLFDLRLGLAPPREQGLALTGLTNDGHDEKKNTPSAGTKGMPGRPTASGTLSVSLERVPPEKKVVQAVNSTSAGGEEQGQEGVVLPGEDIGHALLEVKARDDVETGMGGMTTGATLSEVCTLRYEYPRRKACSLRSLGFFMFLRTAFIKRRELGFKGFCFFQFSQFFNKYRRCVPGISINQPCS